jgi:hypothetical protein
MLRYFIKRNYFLEQIPSVTRGHALPCQREVQDLKYRALRAFNLDTTKKLMNKFTVSERIFIL